MREFSHQYEYFNEIMLTRSTCTTALNEYSLHKVRSKARHEKRLTKEEKEEKNEQI